MRIDRGPSANSPDPRRFKKGSDKQTSGQRLVGNDLTDQVHFRFLAKGGISKMSRVCLGIGLGIGKT